MKNQINDLLRQTISTVNNGHRIYTVDEVTNLLWTLQAKVEEFTETETEPVGRWFTQKQVEEMLLLFGKQISKGQIEYIKEMETEIDLDEIEVEDESDYEVEVGRHLNLEIRYTGDYKYNGNSPSEIVAYQLENEFDFDVLTSDVTLFMQNEISRQANVENVSSEFMVCEDEE